MLVRDQDLLDVIGMIQHKRGERTQPDADDVAVVGADAGKKRQRVAPDLGEASEKQPAPRPWWEHSKILLCPTPWPTGDTSGDDGDRVELDERADKKQQRLERHVCSACTGSARYDG